MAQETCRRPDQEFAVEMALRVAGMEGDEAIVKPRKGIGSRRVSRVS